jgi:multidrug efflux pump subunit AcrB
MYLTKQSVKYGAAVAVVVGLICLFGLVSLNKLPLQLLPNVTEPQITIYNNWRSAAPQEVEEAIVQPQEDILKFNTGLSNITSNTSRGSGQVTLNYQLGYDMNQAMLDVINRLNQAPPIPLDAGEPFVASGGDSGLPGAASILVYTKPDNPAKDMIVYQDLIDEYVEPRLSRIPGVAQVNLQGRRPQVVNVTIDPYKTAAMGIQISEVSQALNRARDVSGGFADVGRRRYTVRFMGEESASELGNLVVSWRNEQPVYLRELATISIDYEENNGISLRNGFPSYYITLTRRNDANTVELLDNLNLAIDELNREVLDAEGLRMEVSFDASLHIRRAISMVQGNLVLGIFLATFVLWYFLRNVRATLVITMTVPISLLVAFIALEGLGLTLNVISLAGLAFAVGLIMDAAIIVQENIYRLRQSGMKLQDAIINGCGQVSGALFSSTLTTVAIFIPILFMVGIEGQLFKDLAITISIAVLVSMVSALTVLPAISAHWIRDSVQSDRHTALWDRLSHTVVKLTDSVRARIAIIVAILGVAALSIWILVPKVDFLPKADIDAISVFFNIPPGTNVDFIEKELAREVVRRLKPYYDGEASPAIKAYNFASFGGFATQIYIYPRVSDETDQLIELLRNDILANLPDIQAYVSRGSMIRVGGGGGRSIDVDLQGPDLPALLGVAREAQPLISGLWENTNVRSNNGLELSEPELQFSPNDRRISTAGLDRASVANIVRTYTGGQFVGEYFDGNKRMDMIVRTPSWHSPEALTSLPVATPLAGVQSLGDLIEMNRTVGPTSLRRVDGRRTVTLSVLPPPHVTLEEAIEKLQAEAGPAIKEMLPPGSTIKYRGNADRLRQALEEVTRNFMLAMLILFMIMAALFKSIRDSFLVLLVMPIALAGGLAGLKILNLVVYQSLDLLTMIGFIILLGLVVNNAILLVDQTRKAELGGKARRDAVLQAVRFRARPIFMSSLTSIFGMLPLMLVPGVGSEIYRGLATVIVGGMLVTGLLTLILLPGLLRLEIDMRLPDYIRRYIQPSGRSATGVRNV